MATKVQTDQLEKVLNQLLMFKIEGNISNARLDNPVFEAARINLADILFLVDDIKSLPIQYLPSHIIEQIHSSLCLILPCYHKYKKFFSSESQFPIQAKERLANDIQKFANDIFSKAIMCISFLFYKIGDVANVTRLLSETFSRAEILCNENKSKMQRNHQQIDDLLSKAREAAASVGAAVFTEDFSNEAKRNKKNSWWWLGATICFIGVAFALSIWAYRTDYSQYSTALSLWPKLASKMILLSLCVTAATWCGRIYKSTRHLFILNQHRALGLKTFQAFSSAASDSHTKDIVLMETTRSIFSNSSTGLIAETGTSESDSNIIQIAGKALEQTHRD